MRRRYVYDVAADRVVEVGAVRGSGLPPRDRYAEAEGQYQHQFNRAPGDGSQLRTAALERAERREWAYKKFGTESRWAD